MHTSQEWAFTRQNSDNIYNSRNVKDYICLTYACYPDAEKNKHTHELFYKFLVYDVKIL